MGGFVITPLFLESVFGYPETRVGGLMIARPLAFAIAGPLAGLRRRPGGGARVGGGRRRCSSWRRWSRCPRVAPGSSDLVIIGALALSGRRPRLLVAGAGREHRQRRRRARPRRGRRLPADDDPARRGARHPADADRHASSAQHVVGEVEAYGEAYLLAAVVAAVGVVCALFVQSTRRAEGAPEGALARDRLRGSPLGRLRSARRPASDARSVSRAVISLIFSAISVGGRDPGRRTAAPSSWSCRPGP